MYFFLVGMLLTQPAQTQTEEKKNEQQQSQSEGEKEAETHPVIMVNMVSISGSVAPTRKKNVARILTLSILAMAFMFWGEFGFDFLLGSGGHDDESIGIISRRLLQNKKEPGRRNQNAIADQTHRNAKARRQDRQQRKRSLNDAKDVDFGTPPRENLGAPHRQGQSQHRQAQQAQRDTISEQRSLFANLLSY